MHKLCLRVLWAAVFALLASSAAAQIVINEVLYDPEGRDRKRCEPR